jgi:hypothetical protein
MHVLLIVVGVIAAVVVVFIAGAVGGMLVLWQGVKADLRAWQRHNVELEEKTLDAQAEAERMRKENISLLNEKLRA